MWLDKNSVMTEQQILKKIEVWSDEDDIQAVVDFIESLSVEDKTPEVLNELGRAYNNLYWLRIRQYRLLELPHWLFLLFLR